MDCIFCKIINNELSSYKVYEDEKTLVIMDNANDVNGHMIAMPKKHVKSILDCDVDTLNNLMKTVRIISNHCIENCGFFGINLLNANEESAGQSILHFHIHIIPRMQNDSINAWPDLKGNTIPILEMYKKLKI
ncbi:MAG: HIT domain-containing protein [Candidatus Moranbacteria bacterium]|nr:HIT domain-containing protein [Candidatus Moranbacteria bacterium]